MYSRANTLFRYVLHVAVPLLAGGGLYLVWRSDRLLMFDWAARFGLDGLLLSLRSLPALREAPVPEWALYSLPAALWTYALFAYLTLLWGRATAPPVRPWLLLALLLSVGAECAQAVGLLPGVFCPVDMAATGLALSAGMIFPQKKKAPNTGSAPPWPARPRTHFRRCAQQRRAAIRKAGDMV